MEKTVYFDVPSHDTRHLPRRSPTPGAFMPWVGVLKPQDISLSSYDTVGYGLAAIISRTERGDLTSYVDGATLYDHVRRHTQNLDVLRNLSSASFARKLRLYADCLGIDYVPGQDPSEASGLYGYRLRADPLDVPSTAEQGRLLKHMLIAAHALRTGVTATDPDPHDQVQDLFRDQSRERVRERVREDEADHDRSR